MEMLSGILEYIPADFIRFVLVVLFSLLIGLEQRSRNIDLEFESIFGTDRTFTLIGILGYILYIIEPGSLVPFLAGGGVIAALLGIFYYQKIQTTQKFGLTAIIIAMLAYCLTPLIYTQPVWLVLSVVVCILIIAGLKEALFKFSKKFEDDEFITLAKFLVLAGIILPLLPDKPVIEGIQITPYRLWLAVVVVSGISYLSYILKKFVFPDAGILLTGILGGLYSSTATTIILARKSKESPGSYEIPSAILLATTMMYIRIFALAFLFNRAVAWALSPYFIIFVVVSAVPAIYFVRQGRRTGAKRSSEHIELRDNPLEFVAAIVFAGLFVFFVLVTNYVLKIYGGVGMNVMAFVVGVTDIDPFILSLFQGKWEVVNSVIVMSVLNAIISNNVLKLIYALVLSDKSSRGKLITGFSVLIALGAGVSVFYFLVN